MIRGTSYAGQKLCECAAAFAAGTFGAGAAIRRGKAPLCSPKPGDSQGLGRRDGAALLLSKAQSDDSQQTRLWGGYFSTGGEYCLSRETVKKIVYDKKAREYLPFHPHADCAKQYSRAGLLEEWIHTYLLYERRNKEFSDGLYRYPREYIGPLALPLSLFTQSSGPEEHMKWRVHPDVWERNVAARQQLIRRWEPLPPLIVNYGEEGFELNCGSPLYEALTRENVPYFPVIIWCSSEADRAAFVRKYLAAVSV